MTEPRSGAVTAMGAAVLLLAVAMTGCMPVENVYPGWYRAKPDANLVGVWKWQPAQKQDEPQWFEVTEDVEAQALRIAIHGPRKPMDEARENAVFGRSITLDQKMFVIVAEREQKRDDTETLDDKRSGFLVRYVWEDGEAIVSCIKPKVVVEAVKAKDVAGELSTQPGDAVMPKLATLDDATLAWLARMAADESVWEVSGRLVREKDLDAALQAAREAAE